MALSDRYIYQRHICLLLLQLILLYNSGKCLSREEHLSDLLVDESDQRLGYKEQKNISCWGYEHNCQFERSFSASKIKCDKKIEQQWRNPMELKLNFWKQGDFGKISDVVDTLQSICKSSSENGSTLECSRNLRFCRAKNIFFDLKSLNAVTSTRYRADVINKDEVGGKCDSFIDDLLKSQVDERSYLQSWADEFINFKSYEDFTLNSSNCDFIFEKPTIVMKLDASVNMYHHFCDFINLYMSLHVNGSFDLDNDILWWDTWKDGYVDSLFGVTWKAFSTRKPYELISFDGKKICFRNAIFPLLARQRLGLYYNMPLVNGCLGSGLFAAFSTHLLRRLNITERGPLLDKIRITFLSRSTKFRRVLNIDELFNVLNDIPNAITRKVDYNREMCFLEQLNITHDTDILIGMHGSGLTHLLFLPEWASVFEIYNCDDPSCYLDLARLKGVKYFTWKKEDKMKQIEEDVNHHRSHKKFSNYEFDKDEFRRIVLQQIEYVRRHESFVAERRRIRRSQKKEL